MQSIPPPDPLSLTVVRIIRSLLDDAAFVDRHRTRPTHFTRKRLLPFPVVMVLLLQKTVRSIQTHLHDFFAHFTPDIASPGAAAWCEARLKLSHSAFVELTDRAILDVVYDANNLGALKRWRGLRLLAIDSSLIRLPNEEAVGDFFGWVQCSNQKGVQGRYPQARLSVLTDVINRITLQTLFVPCEQGERGLAVDHIRTMLQGDLALLDRGFAGFELFAAFVASQRLFVCRCPRSSFAAVNQLFAANQEDRSVTVTLKAPSDERAMLERAGLPTEITIRFVTVRLSTGELEVLATNLLDEELYPTKEFGPLYHCRWGIETFYGLIKGRLDLENFTGLSVEAIKQDVHATIFVSNLETILVTPVQKALHERSAPLQHQQQVNHAVSFHSLKQAIIQLLLSSEPVAEVVSKIQELCLDNPVCVRPNRIVPRNKASAWRSYHYQRNTRKMVF